MYMFPKLDIQKFNIHSDEKFVLDLLRKEKVLLVHGKGFNWHSPDHFRVVTLLKSSIFVGIRELPSEPVIDFLIVKERQPGYFLL